MKLSISFRTSTKMTSVKHNNRDLTEKEWQEPAHSHIVRELSDDNLYIKQENLKKVYDKLFGEALEDYNSKQKRKDRKIDDFYHHVKKSKTLDLQREFIVGLGTKEDWDILSWEEKKLAGEKLREYVEEFQQRHSHLYVYNAVVHLDEAGAPHAHFNIVPVADGYKNGLKLKPSFKKALANEGYKDNGRTLLKHFKDDEVKILENKLQELGYQKREVGTNDIKDMYEYKKIVGQADKDLGRKLVDDYGAPEYINETTGLRKTTVRERMNWVENRFAHLDRQFLKLSKEVSDKRTESIKISEEIEVQEEKYKKNRSVLQKQKEKIKELSSYNVQDYKTRRESKELVQELESIIPRRLGGGFLFSDDFVQRLKKFMMSVIEKLDKATNQNSLLRRTVEESAYKQQELKKRNRDLEEYATELKLENTKLKKDNESLKGSKSLLEDIRGVLTDKEANILNKRLEERRGLKMASRGRQGFESSKGRNL